MSPNNNNNNTFYLSQVEPNKSCLMTLRYLILGLDSDVTETVKYKMPCFVFKSKAFCYLWTDKKTKEPYLLMVDGNRMKHPLLEQGDRSRMKILRVNPNKDIDINAVKEVLNEALSLLE